MFKFSASDPQGASNIAAIQGIFSVGGNDTDGTGGPTSVPAVPDNGLCSFYYDAINNIVFLGDGTGSGWIASSVVGSGGSDLSTPGGCIIHAATSTSWISLNRPQAVPIAYVVDLNLDVSLPNSPINKYHIYSFVEDRDLNFDACGTLTSSCPTWKYSGYWWNVQ
jgi:hypothetical protein